MKDIGTQALLTNNLFLRRFEITDANSMFLNWSSDAENCQYMSWPHHCCIDDCLTTLNDWILKYSDTTFYNWAITKKADINDVIGRITLSNSNCKNKSIEIGYILSKQYQRLGLMSEALKAIISYAFDSIGVELIYAEVSPENHPSQYLLLSFGFKYVGNIDCFFTHKSQKVTCKRYELYK